MNGDAAKRILEAVVTATLSALAAGFVAWGFEVAKDRAKPHDADGIVKRPRAHPTPTPDAPTGEKLP